MLSVLYRRFRNDLLARTDRIVAIPVRGTIAGVASFFLADCLHRHDDLDAVLHRVHGAKDLGGQANKSDCLQQLILVLRDPGHDKLWMCPDQTRYKETRYRFVDVCVVPTMQGGRARSDESGEERLQYDSLSRRDPFLVQRIERRLSLDRCIFLNDQYNNRPPL